MPSFLAEPLLFYEPEFENLEWQTSTAAQEDILQHLQKMWTQYATKYESSFLNYIFRSKLVETMLSTVESELRKNTYLRPISRHCVYMFFLVRFR